MAPKKTANLYKISETFNKYIKEAAMITDPVSDMRMQMMIFFIGVFSFVSIKCLLAVSLRLVECNIKSENLQKIFVEKIPKM